MTDHFTLLSLPRAFDIDKNALDQQYFALQRALHPDRFATKSEAEKTAALQHSMTANEAYETLKNPFKRGEYLLALQGIIVKEGGNVKPSQGLLMEIMALRERVEENDNSVNAEVARRKDETLQEISTLFTAEDYANAAQAVIRLRYLEKTQEELRR